MIHIKKKANNFKRKVIIKANVSDLLSSSIPCYHQRAHVILLGLLRRWRYWPPDGREREKKCVRKMSGGLGQPNPPLAFPTQLFSFSRLSGSLEQAREP